MTTGRLRPGIARVESARARATRDDVCRCIDASCSSDAWCRHTTARGGDDGAKDIAREGRRARERERETPARPRARSSREDERTTAHHIALNIIIMTTTRRASVMPARTTDARRERVSRASSFSRARRPTRARASGDTADAMKDEASGYEKRAEESKAAGVLERRPPRGGDPPEPGSWSWTPWH